MSTYRLNGSHRQINAIGEMEHFTTEIKANTPKEAMNNQREILYNAGYEHILFKHCFKKFPSWSEFGGYDWVEIPMIKALELE